VFLLPILVSAMDPGNAQYIRRRNEKPSQHSTYPFPGPSSFTETVVVSPLRVVRPKWLTASFTLFPVRVVLGK
jgi:hypothetical protein